jgi:hypothetical protein
MRAGRPSGPLMPTSVMLDGMLNEPPRFWSVKLVYSWKTVLPSLQRKSMWPTTRMILGRFFASRRAASSCSRLNTV